MDFEPEPTLIEWVRYNQWANQALMAICMLLDAERVNAEMPGAYGSILSTFAHILKAEASFLRRIHGHAPEPPFRWEDRPSLADMAAFDAVLGARLLDTLQQVPPTHTVHEEGSGWTFDYQARLIYMSIAYHGVAHRTDITTFLHRQGVTLPELDVWGYQAAHPERFQARSQTTGDPASG